MSTLHSKSSNQRFAWLTPLQARETSSGPWLLCENRTYHKQDDDNSTMKVTIDALLRLLAAAFVDRGDEHGENLTNPSSYQSDCQRFKIKRHQLDKDNTPLFVQQRTDYFQRLELFIDTKLVAAYHEPVWPHLQDPNALRSTHLDLPVDCMKFLEQRAAEARGPHPSLTSSNQEYHAIEGGNTAAA